MKNYVESGDVITVYNTNKNYKSGDLYVEYSLVGVCVNDFDPKGYGVATRGVYEVPKDPTVEVMRGERVYSKEGEPVTTDSNDKTYVGVAIRAADKLSEKVKVKLN